MKLNPEILARASSRHPWRTIGAWFLAIVAMGALTGSLLAGVLTQDIAFTNKPESVKAQDIIDEHFSNGADTSDTEFLIVSSDSVSTTDAAFQDRVQSLKADLENLGPDDIAAPVFTYVDAQQAGQQDQAASLVSQDGTTALIPVAIADTTDAIVADLREVAAGGSGDGFTVQVAGQATLSSDFTKVAEEDLKKGESIGIGVALIVLVVVFAAIIAAVVPIVMAIFAIIVALGLVSLIGQIVQFNLFVENIVTMIGLAVGIDYSLFIVSRYREERKKGFDKLGAIGAAGATANRAVFFSGMTVVLALLGMFIIPTTIFRSLATGAILVTIASIAASMTLLPAILALLGDRINWPRLSKRAKVDSSPDPKGGFWDRLTRGVMTHPVVFLLASILVLGGLGSFYFQMNRGTSQNVSTLPDGFESKAAFLTLQDKFGAGGTTDPRRSSSGRRGRTPKFRPRSRSSGTRSRPMPRRSPGQTKAVDALAPDGIRAMPCGGATPSSREDPIIGSVVRRDHRRFATARSPVRSMASRERRCSSAGTRRSSPTS